MDKLFESSDEDEAAQSQATQDAANAGAEPEQPARELLPDDSDAQQAPTPSEGGTPAAPKLLTANRWAAVTIV